MAATIVDICNMALLRIGVKALIADMDEDSTEAEVCSVIYEPTRDRLLEEFAWPWAMKRAELALVSGDDRNGWAYAYALPVDCLAPRAIWNGDRNSREDARVPFAIESNAAGDGRLLLTDQSEAELLYTAAISAPSALPPLFVDALAWALAVELTLSITVRPDLAARAEQKAIMSLSAAKRGTLTQRQPDPQPESEFIAIRG